MKIDEVKWPDDEDEDDDDDRQTIPIFTLFKEFSLHKGPYGVTMKWLTYPQKIRFN